MAKEMEGTTVKDEKNDVGNEKLEVEPPPPKFDLCILIEIIKKGTNGTEVEQALKKEIEDGSMYKDPEWQMAAVEQGLIAALTGLLADSCLEKYGNEKQDDSDGTTITKVKHSESTILGVTGLLLRLCEVPGTCRSELGKEQSVDIMTTILCEKKQPTELVALLLVIISSLVFSSSTTVSVLEANYCMRGRAIVTSILSTAIEQYLDTISIRTSKGESESGHSANDLSSAEGSQASSKLNSSAILCERAIRLFLFMCRSYALRLGMIMSDGFIPLLVRVILESPLLSSSSVQLFMRLTHGPALIKKAMVSKLNSASGVGGCSQVVESLMSGVCSDSLVIQESSLCALVCLAETRDPSICVTLEKDAFAVKMVLGLLEELERDPVTCDTKDRDGHGADHFGVEGSKSVIGEAGEAGTESVAAEEHERDAIARITVMATAFGLNKEEEKGDAEGADGGEDESKKRPVDTARSCALQVSALKMMLMMMKMESKVMSKDFLLEAKHGLTTLLDNLAFKKTSISTMAGNETEDIIMESQSSPLKGANDFLESETTSPVKDTGVSLNIVALQKVNPLVIKGAISVLRYLMHYESSGEDELTSSVTEEDVPTSRSLSPLGEHEERMSATELLLSPDFVSNLCDTLTSTTSQELQCEILDLYSDLSMELSLEKRPILSSNGILQSLKQFAKQQVPLTGVLKTKLASALFCFSTEEFIPSERPSEEDVKPELLVPRSAYDWDALGRDTDIMLL